MTYECLWTLFDGQSHIVYQMIMNKSLRLAGAVIK